MVPTNTTPQTAIVITTLPYKNVQNVQQAPDQTAYPGCGGTPQRHAVWYRYVTGPTEYMISIGCTGVPAGANYYPVQGVWKGDLTGLYMNLDPTGKPVHTFCGGRNGENWLEVPVTPNTLYYFQITQGRSTGTTEPIDYPLTFEVRSAPTDAAVPGDHLISDDTSGFGAKVVSQVTGKITAYLPTLDGNDMYASLKRGLVASQYLGSKMLILDPSQNWKQVAVITPIGGLDNILNSDNHFFLISRSKGTRDGRTVDITNIQEILPDGTIVMTRTVTVFAFPVMISADGAIYYYGDDVNYQAVHRWDLVNNVPLPDFTPGYGASEESGFGWTDPMTGHILMTWRFGGFAQVKLREYLPDGTLLKTTDMTPLGIDRMYPDLYASVFSVWGTHGFGKVKTAIATSYYVTVQSPGITTQTGTPQGNAFQISDSCTEGVVPRYPGAPTAPAYPPDVGGGPTGPLGGPLRPIRRMRQGPHINQSRRKMFATLFRADIHDNLGTDPATPPQLWHSWSKNGGRTWTPYEGAGAGLATDVSVVNVEWRRLGESKDRVDRILAEDPIPWRITNAYIDLIIGSF